MQWLLITCSHARAYACMDKSYKHFTVTSVTASTQTTLFQVLTNRETVLNNFYTSYASSFLHSSYRKLCCHLFICSIFTPLSPRANRVRWQMWQQKTLNHWVIHARTFRAHVRDSLAYSLPLLSPPHRLHCSPSTRIPSVCNRKESPFHSNIAKPALHFNHTAKKKVQFLVVFSLFDLIWRVINMRGDPIEPRKVHWIQINRRLQDYFDSG